MTNKNIVKQEINEDVYYSPHGLKTYNSLFSFSIGERGKGKTYSLAKADRIDDFINNGWQFIYLRRHKNELKTVNTFFDDIRDKYPNNKLEVKNKVFYCDGKIMGYAIHLSTANMLKSTAFPLVQTIVFDEFILPKGYVRYLDDEVNTFLNFYETVARLRPNVKVYFLGNAISLVNPYFVYWKIMPDTKKRFTKVKKKLKGTNKGRHLIVVEILQDKEMETDGITYRDIKGETDFAEIVDGTDYSAQSNHNEFIYDTDDFIEKKSADSRYVYGMVYGGKMYGVWVDSKNGKFYVSHKYDINNKKIYAITSEDFKVNMFLVDNLKNYNGLVVLKKAFVGGYLMFENLQIKDSMFSMMKLFGC